MRVVPKTVTLNCIYAKERIGVVMKNIKSKIMLIMATVVILALVIVFSENKILTAGIIVGILLVIFALFKLGKYLFSAYFRSTKQSYFKVLFNKEASLRYSTFKVFNKKLSGVKKVVCDVYMPKIDGSVSKADMVLLNETGIYVIDVKPYTGRVAGAEQGKEWTYTKGGKTENIPNPLIWNKLQMKWLKSYISEFPHTHYFSYVVYKTGCKIKDITFKTYEGTVATRSMLPKEVMRNAAKVGTSLAISEIDVAFDKVKALASADFAANISDVQGIQETIFYENKKEFNEYDYKNPDLE